MLECLLEQGADVTARAEENVTPFHVAAAANDNPKVLELLLDRGANANLLKDSGWTPPALGCREQQVP